VQANILVDATGNARIVDFGLATVARDSNSLVSTVDEQGITARYTAPEILKSDVTRHTKESDVFSFGMIMVVVCDESASCRVISLVDGGLHRRRSVP